jgi:alpha-tubulin suppressor-like RCC1 family protein/roadblock/LC7 domain-containing protein
MKTRVAFICLLFLLLAACGNEEASVESPRAVPAGVTAMLTRTQFNPQTPAPTGRKPGLILSTNTPTTTQSPSIVPARASAQGTLIPTRSIPSISKPPAYGPETAATLIAAGRNHTCAATTAGGVECWGENEHGQLGDGTTAGRNMPVPVNGLAGEVTAIAAGNAHTCVLTSAGGVKCWGANGHGELGNGAAGDGGTPTDVSGLTGGVYAIAAGNEHSCAVTTGGDVFCWGLNANGQLGDGTKTDSRIPVRVAGIFEAVKGIAAGAGHTCALTVRGGVLCWGDNQYGQLGDGKGTKNRVVPEAVIGLKEGVSAFSARGGHTCSLMTNSGVKCWGNNQYGQLGDGTKTNRAVPVDLLQLGRGVSAVAAGSDHTCASIGGKVKCWGWNYYGQLGDGTKTTQGNPVAADGVPVDVRMIGAGGAHTCVVTGRGGVTCWGGNSSGQLGDGTTFDSGAPVDVKTFHDPVRMSEIRKIDKCVFDSYVPRMAFSSDGRYFACIVNMQEVVVWQVSPWQEIKQIKYPSGDLYKTAFSPDGKTLALAGRVNPSGNIPENRIVFWDLETDRALFSLTGTWPVAFSPDGRWIAFVSQIQDPYTINTIEIWDWTTGEKIQTIRIENNSNYGCEAAVFSPDGTKLAANCPDGRIRVWDIATGQQLYALHGKYVYPNGITAAFSPDGKILAYIPDSEQTDRIELVDPETGAVVRTLIQPEDSSYSISSILFSPDGAFLIAGGGTNVIFWDLKTAAIVHTLDLRGRISVFAGSPDGRWFASGSYREVFLWGDAS